MMSDTTSEASQESEQVTVTTVSKLTRKEISLPAPEIDITLTELWWKVAPGTLGPGHDALAHNLEVVARQNQDIRLMLSKLVTSKSATRVRRQQATGLWQDEELKKRIVVLSQAHKEKGGKMVLTTSKNSGDYARTWRNYCTGELDDTEIDRRVRQALEPLGEGTLLVVYLHCSKLLSDQPKGGNILASEKAATAKCRAGRRGKRKQAEVDDVDLSAEGDRSIARSKVRGRRKPSVLVEDVEEDELSAQL